MENRAWRGVRLVSKPEIVLKVDGKPVFWGVKSCGLRQILHSTMKATLAL
jgi:hypothetical protein